MAKAQGFGRMPYAELIRETGNRLDDRVTLLGDRAFFFSDRISAADLALYGELRTGASGSTPDFEELVARRPVLEAHSRRGGGDRKGLSPRSDRWYRVAPYRLSRLQRAACLAQHATPRA